MFGVLLSSDPGTVMKAVQQVLPFFVVFFLRGGLNYEIASWI